MNMAVNIKYIKGAELRKMQLVLLDAMVEVDRVCRANDIQYCIAFGTLLGAVRSGGYIPWDDDIDICMTRENYDRFAKVANQLNHDICFFQDNDNDPEYPWGYGKIRRSGTSYIRVGQEHLKHKDGMFIDLFPMDDVPTNPLMIRLHLWLCFVLRKITYAQIGWRNEKSAVWRAWYKVVSFIPVRCSHKIASLLRNSRNNKTPNRAHMWYIVPDAILRGHLPLREACGFKKSWLTDLVEMDFEGHKFYATREYRDCLAWSFGDDFMIPPPMNERESHAPCSDYSFGKL